jgi:uncharacterized RDD family membrane protein YckC
MSSLPPPPPPGSASVPPPPPPGYAAPGDWGVRESTAERAGFGRRLAGFILDALLYGLAALVYLVPAVAVGTRAYADCVSVDDDVLICPRGAPDTWLVVVAIAIGVLGTIGLFVLYVRSLGRYGRTWGRTIVGIQVVDITTGDSIGVPRAIGRTLFEVFVSSNLLYLGHLWMLWSKDRQTWHDTLTKSTVVRT